MNEHLLSLWNQSGEFARLQSALREGDGPAAVYGAGEEAALYLWAALLQHTGGLVVLPTEREAAQVADRLAAVLGSESVFFLPAREVQLRAYFARSRELSATRIRALCALLTVPRAVVACSAEAALQRLAPPQALQDACTTLRVGECRDPEALAASLRAAGYERVERVEAPGQFRLSGSILDVFPCTVADPYRVEFFDDEIDSIRTYDTGTQRSTGNLESAGLVPAVEIPLTPEAVEQGRKALAAYRRKKSIPKELVAHFDEALLGGDADEAEAVLPLLYESATAASYLPKNAPLFVWEPNRADESAKAVLSRFRESVAAALEDGECLPCAAGLLESDTDFWRAAGRPNAALFFPLTRTFTPLRAKALFRFETRAATRYSAAIDALASDLSQLKKTGTTALLYAGSRAARLQEDLARLGAPLPLLPSLERPAVRGEQLILASGLPCGFELPELKLAVFSEEDLYGAKKSAVRQKKRREVTRFDLFADLAIGDAVVHESYGIGVFQGIVQLTSEGKTRDFMQIQYAGTDKLYVPVDQLDRVQKYIGAGSDEKFPKLSKLTGGDWNRSVAKVRSSVKELAFDLVKLYADRKSAKGFAFSPDSPWQKEMEDAFPYELTPDQRTCVEDIKADMESGVIMDRLLCGDVGYGKTEVALRAAFKAVQDSKQVAVLVPTTVLAQQHYQTLCARFSGFPVRVELLSRFRSAAAQKETLKGLKTGAVDVVVGTHRLLGKDVQFKDLGLLIIDEEQRFGVGHKEQIKNIKRTVDVLTLSATPIPRTLHMALSGVRDMSVIETPPEERFPVQTYVMEYSDSLVRDAILKETGRGGQVFFLYNRVQDMESFASRLRELVPEVSIAMAHGQMREGQLEKTMVAFLEGQYDVLLCSTIIESGLDIQNANTLIVYDADKMGLSQLYQLRGRVGRSNRLAYAFFTFRPERSLSEVAEKRLRAIREFTQFGSGFKIAMRDLEIRGAGNLIGAQQHGHMAAVGYDYYCKLMDEALHEARGEKPPVEIDTQMDVPVSAYLPHSYIADEAQRLELYKRIASIEGRAGLPDVTDELIDRFGDPPQPVLNLLEIAAVKGAAKAAGLAQLSVRPGTGVLQFHPETRVTGDVLIAVLSGYKGRAALLSADPPKVRLSSGSEDVLETLRACESFIKQLLGE